MTLKSSYESRARRRVLCAHPFKVPRYRKDKFYEDVSHALTQYVLSAVHQGRVAHDLGAITHEMYALLRGQILPKIDIDSLILAAAAWVYRKHDPSQFSIKQAARRAKITPFDLDQFDDDSPAWRQAEVLGVSRATITNHRRWRREIETDPVKARYWRRVAQMKTWLAHRRVMLGKFVKAHRVRVAWRKEQEQKISAKVSTHFENLVVLKEQGSRYVPLVLPVRALEHQPIPIRDTSFDDLLFA